MASLLEISRPQKVSSAQYPTRPRSELHRLAPREILDLGCGGGFFLFVARALGHRGLGLDVGGIPLFDDLVDLLGIDRVEYRISGLEMLPDLGRKFDLITAFATAFQGGREDSWRWASKNGIFF